MKDMWKGKMECIKEAYPDATTPAPGTKIDEETKKKWMTELASNVCVSVCSWKKQGTLKADGTYDSAGAETNMKAILPEKAVADMKKALDECAAASSSEFSMDNKCAGYTKFRDCQMKKFMEVCEITKKE